MFNLLHFKIGMNLTIIKYQNKVKAAATEYDSLNERLKWEMIATKETHDDLIEAMLITFVTAQVTYKPNDMT
jgi:hypothetical protein